MPRLSPGVGAPRRLRAERRWQRRQGRAQATRSHQGRRLCRVDRRRPLTGERIAESLRRAPAITHMKVDQTDRHDVECVCVVVAGSITDFVRLEGLRSRQGRFAESQQRNGVALERSLQNGQIIDLASDPNGPLERPMRDFCLRREIAPTDGAPCEARPGRSPMASSSAIWAPLCDRACS